MQAFFNHWQRKYIGRMLTFLLGVLTAAVGLYLLAQLVRAIAFLQPVLIPLAIAAVLAFLLEPVVRVLCAKTHFSRTVIVLSMMAIVALTIVGAGIWVVPRAYESTSRMIRDTPAFMQKAQQRLFAVIDATQAKVNKFDKALPPVPTPAPLEAAPVDGGKPEPVHSDKDKGAATPAPSPGGASPAPTQQSDKPAASQGNESPAPNQQGDKPAPSPREGSSTQPPQGNKLAGADLNKNGHLDSDDFRMWISSQLPKLQAQAPELARKVGEILLKTLGGFMGAFGVLLNAIIIPIYIFFLLTEARNISKRWADFLPLKDSQFKQEVVSTMGEIQGYLVAFFRGQLIVSTIDAVLITLGLWLFVGLNFSVVIGLLVLVLTFIPYLGIMICYVPAILIAIVQFGDWQHPMYVIAVMFGVQTAESTIISPKIVGESTGLHPLTVIVSVFAWEIILGGPIGALLAVPLTASLKVIMRRYVWERARVSARILPTASVAPVLRAGDRDRFGDGQPDVTAVPEVVAHPQDKPIAPANADSANPPGGKQD